MAAITRREDYVTPPSGLLIYHDGFYDLDGLYDKVKGWFFKRRYDYVEKEMQVKHKAQGREVVLGLWGEREVDEFFKFHIRMQVFSIRTQKVKDGYVGWIKINVQAYIELDWTKKWQKTPWKRFLFYVYVNYVIKDRIQRVYENKLYGELLEVIAVAKSCLREVHH